MIKRASAAGFAIDVSRLPPPVAIKSLDYEAIVAARGQALRRRFAELGVDYDVETLETDPGMILQQVDASRELLDKAQINDTVRAVLPAFARDGDLDQVVARANVERLVLVEADEAAGIDRVMESDASLLQRYLASFAAPAAGSEDGYLFRAATAYPLAHDIAVEHGGGGKVLVYLLGEAGRPAPLDAVLTVAKALNQKHAKGLTDDITVSAATIATYSARLKLEVPRGPDTSLIVGQATAAVRAFALDRYAIGAGVPSNAIEAAAYVPNVSRVVPVGTLNDIAGKRGVAPWLSSLSITAEVVG